ncbi:MAG TPA: proline--tRNA ligase [Anaerolineaceae bacterium]|nr:proline--tRNA ligase [Anaerolineaceae bacterium]HPN52477.1 proline--tRNA ligase [Anaerolineaceae bacterium]
MRYSRLFSQTLREPPSEAEVASHQLLLRAGFIRQLGAGIFTAMPLARRAVQRIEAILREEINAIGGQEITMPVINPASIWQETGRWFQIGAEMGRFKDRNGHDMALAMTHEEVVADLVRHEIRSYRQLPALIYHIQTKWRDDPRPRAGLIRVREFTMLDSYSLDANWEGLDAQYEAHYQAYMNIFRRCGLPVVAVKSDTGMMGGKMAHEYMYLTPIGEDTLLFCDACGYSANRQVARLGKPHPAAEAPLALEPVATPETKTIADLAALLNVPASRTAKAVFLVAEMEKDGQKSDLFVFAVVRGDMDVNETKLSAAVSASGRGALTELRPAHEEEILAVGAQPGYASPVGLKPRAGALPLLVVADDLIPHSPNLVAGANREGYHLLNTNYGRDYTAEVVADIVSAENGAACPECGAAMRASRGVEVGNIFKLGTRYSEALGCDFLAEDGSTRPVIMGSYGIGVGRLLACAAEEHHDDKGLIWPVSIAPYPVHLVMLPGKSGAEAVLQAAEGLEQMLTAAGLEPLVDDRAESAGVKFMDADLIGLPLRITVSERSLKQGGVEFKRRSGGEAFMVPLEEALPRAQAELAALAGALK